MLTVKSTYDFSKCHIYGMFFIKNYKKFTVIFATINYWVKKQCLALHFIVFQIAISILSFGAKHFNLLEEIINSNHRFFFHFICWYLPSTAKVL